jgi:DNA-binding PadR family transcriptional regulator
MAALSPISLAALGLLVERPMHPYEMYQLLLERAEDRLLKVRPGTLYHAVDRLERDGLARALRTERDGNRPERTTFDITESGRRTLLRRTAEMLATPADEYPEFPLAISEAHNLTRAQVIAALRSRMQALADEQEAVASRLRALGGETIPRLYWLDVDYDSAMRAAEIRWLEAVVAELDSGQLPWPDSADVSVRREQLRAIAGPTCVLRTTTSSGVHADG